MLYLACVLNARFLSLSPLHSFVDRAVPFALSARLSLFRLLLSSLLAQYRVSRLAERVSWKKKSSTREWRWMKRGIYVNFEYRTAARFEYKLGATLVDCRGNRAEPELRALSPFFWASCSLFLYVYSLFSLLVLFLYCVTIAYYLTKEVGPNGFLVYVDFLRYKDIRWVLLASNDSFMICQGLCNEVDPLCYSNIRYISVKKKDNSLHERITIDFRDLGHSSITYI